MLFFLPLLGSFGCKRIPEQAGKGHEPGDSGAPATTAALPADEDQALVDKLNGYIRDCINRYSKGIHSAEEKYFSWVNAKRGPTGKERNVLGMDEVALDPGACTAAIARSNGSLPKRPDLEKLADAYSTALTAALSLINDAHKYYERGDYKTDKMARGKQLHPKLVLAFDGFDKADGELTRRVDQVQEDLDRRELVRIEKEEGKKAHYHTVNTTLMAKPVLYEGAKDFTKVSLPSLTAATDNFDRALDAFEAWTKQNQAEANSTAAYLRAAKDLAGAARALARRIHDKTPFAPTEKSWMGTSSAWMVEGSPAAVIDRYNKLIDANNAVRF